MVLTVIIPIFLLLTLGYSSVKLKLLTADHIAALGVFVIKIALPALFLQALASKNITQIWIGSFFWVYVAFTFIVYAFAFFVLSHFFKNTASDTSIYALGAAMSNTGLIGTAVLTLIIGEEALTYTSLVVILESVLLLPTVLILVEMTRDSQAEFFPVLKQTTLHLFKSPLFMAVLLGVFCALFQIKIPLYLDQILKLLGQTASPLALFVIGGGIVGLSLKHVDLQSCYLVFSNNILMPLGVYLGLTYFTNLDREIVHIGTIIAALPMPSIFAMLGQLYGLKEKTLTPLLMSTLTGFVVVSALIALWWG